MNDHIIFAAALSGPDAGKPMATDAEIVEALRAPELAWVHLQANHPETVTWIESHLTFVSPVIKAALIAEETRPRTVVIGDGVLLILRGVNTNPGEDPEDMVSIRLWVHGARIVSLSRRPLASVRDIQAALQAGEGPREAEEFLRSLVENLSERIEDYLNKLEDETDDLEEQVIAEPDPGLHVQLTETRRQVVAMRRHIGPQRDALDRLANAQIDLITDAERPHLREQHDRLVRAVEELDTMRDRLQVVKDEVVNHQSERLNRNLYILSLVSAVFLPLGFLTGLMGINLGGMPGAGHPMAFWGFSGALVLIAGLLLILLRRLKMF